MRKTFRMLLAVVFVSGLLAAGCGDDDDSAATTTTSTSEAEGSTTTEASADFEVFLLPAETGEDCSEVIGVPRSATRWRNCWPVPPPRRRRRG